MPGASTGAVTGCTVVVGADVSVGTVDDVVDELSPVSSSTSVVVVVDSSTGAAVVAVGTVMLDPPVGGR
jgi:hypothetical protein